MHRALVGLIAGAMLLVAQPAVAHSPTSSHCNPTTSQECRTVESLLYVHYPNDGFFGGCLDLVPPVEPMGGSYGAVPTLNTGPVTYGPTADLNVVASELTCGAHSLQDHRSKWDIHPGNPPAATFEIRDAKLELTWYLAVDLTGIPQAPSSAPGIGVFSVLEVGTVPFDGLRSQQQPLTGWVLAYGDVGTGYKNPSPGGVAGSSTLVDVRQGEAIYEFTVPMEVRDDVVPSYLTSDFLYLTVVPYQLEDQDVGFTQPRWREYTDPVHASALRITTGPTLSSASAHVTASANRVEIDWDVASPWGAWAVNTSSVSLDIHGPRSIDLDDLELGDMNWISSRVMHHDDQFGPVELSWTYPPSGGTPLPPGNYTLHASIETMGGHDRLTWEEPFTVPAAPSASNDTKTIVFEGETATVPGPGVGAVLLLLALAGARTGRRTAS